MPRYHFSLGNSTEGPIGLGALVVALSPEEAIERLRDALLETIELADHTPGIQYVNLYVNHEAIDAHGIVVDDLLDAPGGALAVCETRGFYAACSRCSNATDTLPYEQDPSRFSSAAECAEWARAHGWTVDAEGLPVCGEHDDGE